MDPMPPKRGVDPARGATKVSSTGALVARVKEPEVPVLAVEVEPLLLWNNHHGYVLPLLCAVFVLAAGCC